MSKEPKSPPPYTITSVDNALRIAAMLQMEGALTVSEVAARLGVARSTAHRLLAMLVYRDFAEQDESRSYRAGPVLELAAHSRSDISRLRAAALPHLVLAAAIEERHQASKALADRLQFEELLSQMSQGFLDVPSERMDDAVGQWLRQQLERVADQRAERGAKLRNRRRLIGAEHNVKRGGNRRGATGPQQPLQHVEDPVIAGEQRALLLQALRAVVQCGEAPAGAPRDPDPADAVSRSGMRRRNLVVPSAEGRDRRVDVVQNAQELPAAVMFRCRKLERRELPQRVGFRHDVQDPEILQRPDHLRQQPPGTQQPHPRHRDDHAASSGPSVSARNPMSQGSGPAKPSSTNFRSASRAPIGTIAIPGSRSRKGITGR